MEYKRTLRMILYIHQSVCMLPLTKTKDLIYIKANSQSTQKQKVHNRPLKAT